MARKITISITTHFQWEEIHEPEGALLLLLLLDDPLESELDEPLLELEVAAGAALLAAEVCEPELLLSVATKALPA